MHVRGQIRARLFETLRTVEGLVGGVVHDFPEVVQETDLPIAYLWIGPEDVQPITLGGLQEREAQVFVDVIGLDNSEQIERLDEILARIETRVAADQTLGGLVQACTLRAVAVDREDGGGQATLRYRVQFDTQYRTLTGAPDAPA